MKLFFALYFFGISTVHSQVAMTFKQADDKGLRISRLDSTYASAMHSDSTKAVFWNNQEAFIESYNKTLQDLGTFLKQNQFAWGKETRCFNRIYFNKDGQIEYFLFSFGKDMISTEKENQFNTLLNKFVKTYKFPLSAKTGFSQCSPVRYND